MVIRRDWSVIKQVIQFLIVDLQESALNDEFCFLFSLINFIKYQPNDPRNDSQVFILKTNCVTTAHGKGLTTSSLSIGKYCSIVSLETAKD